MFSSHKFFLLPIYVGMLLGNLFCIETVVILLAQEAILEHVEAFIGLSGPERGYLKKKENIFYIPLRLEAQSTLTVLLLILTDHASEI